MKNYVYFAGGAIFGAAIGSVITANVLKKVFMKMLEEETDKVVQYYRGHDNVKKATEPPIKEPAVVDTGLVAIRQPTKDIQLEVPAEDFSTELEVVDLGDVKSEDGYTTETFVMYGDGVLTDDADIPLSDAKIDELFPTEIFNQICRCEDSSIYIRNPMERVVYEVIMCPTDFNG